MVDRYPYVVHQAIKIPFVHKQLNRNIIGRYTSYAPERPRKFSLKSNYTSWSSLTDRSYTGRQLPEDVNLRPKPDIKEVAELWRRTEGQEVPSVDTSVLFAFFAQWFTDSFLRTNTEDTRKNNSNHEIDFCQLYGQTQHQTDILRSKSGGKLRYTMHDGEMYPPYLFDPDKTTKDNWVFANPEFEKLHDRAVLARNLAHFSEDRIKYVYATGLEHGNNQIGYTMLSVIFLREHNRICDELAAAYPEWDDDRLFATARMIMIVLLLNIVLSEYVAQVGVVKFPFQAELGWAEKQPWYRGNWINLEFTLLYRWHSMVPDHLEIAGRKLTHMDYRANPKLIQELGIDTIITAASQQKAGKIGLGNTHHMFLDPMPANSNNPSVQELSLRMGRDAKLRSLNDYRELFRLPRIRDFNELVDDPVLANRLRELYKHPDDIEWMPGIFAEKHDDGMMLGELMLRMVAYDAFTHALTNPLLSKNIYGPDTFSPVGMDIINSTTSFRQIVARNSKKPNAVVCSFQAIKKVPGPQKLAPLRRIVETVDMAAISGWTKYHNTRKDRYDSTVFRAHAFKSGVVIMDAKGCEVFTNWDGRLAKTASFGAITVPRELTGRVKPSVFDNTYKHNKYKALYQKILLMRRGDFQSTFKSVLNRHADTWAACGTVDFTDDIERFAMEFLFEWYFGVKIDTDDMRDLYNHIFSHQPRILARLNPWSKLKSSKRTLDGVLSMIVDSDKFREYSALAAKDRLHDTYELAQQLLFLVGMNNYLGIQSLLKSIIGELSNNSDYATDLRGRLAETDNALDLLQPLIKETLRLHPPVFFIFGVAQKDFTLQSKSGNFEIRKGEHLTGAIPFVQSDEEAYDKPHEFNPNRSFHDPNLIWSHSEHSASVTPHDHGCPGKDVAAYIGAMFAQTMLEKFDWTLAKPAEWSTRKYSLNVAAPIGKMTATIKPRG
ncbi:hypothetical protein BVC71_00040 [Marivivens niveibacter]|uniref:Heme peroxidase n=1 Tax=Marivivens niveibacter TaxID=1930667 RepID=A0A251X1B8_9RHOB|nr:hypothetical protein BVC71_00040 [Marivivens niveibacter]